MTPCARRMTVAVAAALVGDDRAAPRSVTSLGQGGPARNPVIPLPFLYKSSVAKKLI